MHKASNPHIYNMAREYWLSGNFDRVVKWGGIWVDLIDLDRFIIDPSILDDFKSRLEKSEGFLVTLYQGLYFDPEAVCAKITEVKLENNKLLGFIIPYGPKRVAFFNASKKVGCPLFFLGKYSKIMHPPTVTEIVGFRADFSVSPPYIRKR